MRRLLAEDGFTLIEIMVVVFILGLLVTLVAPNILYQFVRSKRTKAAADIKAIAESLQMYKLDNGSYPSTAEGIQALTQTGKTPNADPNGYLPKLPIDPWGNAYVYFTDGSRFIVKSYAADGREGGEGENADIVSDDF